MPGTRMILALMLGLVTAPAAALPPGFAIQEIHSGLNFPTALRFTPDGRLFYTERSGRIMMFESAFSPAPQVWASVPVVTSGERGLLGLTIHPDFPDSPYVYVYHTNPSPLVGRVVRLTDQGGVGVNYTIVMNDLPASQPFHVGGRLEFGPDGMLYVSVGEQTSDGAQDPGTLNGKILRVTPLGQPGPGKPFGSSNPVFVYGVRNSFGVTFDPTTQAGYFTDPGPSCDDEINYLSAGANYGWGPNEFCGGEPAGTTPPMVRFDSGSLTPVGCCVYRGNAYPAHFDGNLFVATFSASTLYRLKFAPLTVNQVDSLEVFAQTGPEMLDVTLGPDGQLWLSTVDAIHRIVAAGNVGVGTGPGMATLAAAPNPFHDRLWLRLGRLPDDARLEILDVQGRVIRRWFGPLPASLLWNGNAADGRPVPAGIYIVRARARALELTRTVLRITR